MNERIAGGAVVGRGRWTVFSQALAIVLFASCSGAPRPVTVPRPSPQPHESHDPTPTRPQPSLIAGPAVRVGLLTDQGDIAFPRIQGGYRLVVDDKIVMTLSRGFSVMAPRAATATGHALQIAALSDRSGAESLARRAQTDFGVSTLVVFDAARGLSKVLVGDFPTPAAADGLKIALAEKGYGSEPFVVRRPGDGNFQRAIRIEDDEGATHVFNTSGLLILPAGDQRIRIDGQPYRGGARAFVNDRGMLNIINELNLEDYLKGVVPKELGPIVFNQLEALKAQAMAARTYTIQRRGDYMAEGYDICATPACQVYGGFGAEHALSNQAVEETAGLIITWQGEPIDALYTSTCGGATSDVSTMFPGRNEPYLRGVSCVGGEIASLEGRRSGNVVSRTEARSLMFLSMTGQERPAASWSASDVLRGATGAARIAGRGLPSEVVPRSVRRGDILTFLGRAFDMIDASEPLVEPEDRRYLYPAFADDDAARVAAFMAKFGIEPPQHFDDEGLQGAMPRDEYFGILYSWLLRTGSLREETGRISATHGRDLEVEIEGVRSTVQLPPQIPLLRRVGETYRELASLPIVVSDRATIVRDPSGVVRAIVVEAELDGVSFDRTSSYASWIRSWRADELVASISERLPVKDVVDLRPVKTDAAHRVVQLEVVAEGGRTIALEGLPIRWSLRVPDNLFVIDRSVDPDGTTRFTFYGKGWGHGTGMCQVGAYGMAFRGYTAEQILTHYYTGVQISRWGED